MKSLYVFASLIVMLGLVKKKLSTQSVHLSSCHQGCENSYRQCTLSCKKLGYSLCRNCIMMKGACDTICEIVRMGG